MTTISAAGNIKLTPKQHAFVNEYLICKNGAEAARRAKYKERSARQMAAENLTKPVIQAAIAAKEAEMAQQYALNKHGVVRELLAAVDIARDKLDPGNMIRAWVEIAKILGIYAPETVKVEEHAENEVLEAKFAAMSDYELMAIARGHPLPQASI